MASLKLSFFGPIQNSLEGLPLEGFRTNKVQALLIYVVTEPKAHSRESLMALLWPGMPGRSARHNLRQILYHLRNAIPELPALGSPENASPVPLLLANRQTIQINPVADVESDVRLFQSLLEEIEVHQHLDLLICTACRRRMEQLIELYRGDFLADFYLEDSNDFEDWAQIHREAYRRRALDALDTLTTITTRQKQYPEARVHVERQLEIDNLREGAYRQLMEILALSGQREGALAVYEKARRLLAEELAMAPSTRTTEIYEKILDGDLNFETPMAQGVRGYELKDEIGEGAYGSIHRAVQPAIGREVAVKVIRRKYANDPEFIRRFEAEAQTVARLEHPYIVPLYDYWRDPDGAYLVMRYLRGGNLLTSLESGPWNPEPAVRLLDQVASALSAAHRQGVIHRDIKPANILLDESGNAFLSDFGIAKDLTGELQLTMEGAILGTPDYISPEQIKNEPIGPQTDIYSLGAVMYETLTGEKPFPDSSIANLIHSHLSEPMPLVSTTRPDIPPEIDAVIQQATAKDPADRYADAIAMAEAFRRAIQGDVSRGLDLGVGLEMVPISSVSEIYNPYKGLQAFQEADADDFFGRETLVDQLIARLAPSPKLGEGRGGDHFLAVVGPSGSGKSSVVKAGLIPALRSGALPGSDKWFAAEMVPGTHPLEELELALWPVAVDPPPSLVEPMQKDIRGMLRTIRRVLPDEEDAQLLLVIDQFEELFTLVDDDDRRTFFLDSLLAAISAPRSPLRVVITLRADFYDRPLQHQRLGQLIKDNTEIVLPLTPEELTWAVQEPARRVGVGLESGLAPSIVGDVSDQPGALPLLQYALTELFERRQDHHMTRSAYQEIGGVLGALGRRAEEIYQGLGNPGQESSRQLFLRLVTLGEGVEDTRRRVLRTELAALTNDERRGTYESPGVLPSSSVLGPSSLIDSVIDHYGLARLLTFDHDPITRGPTVEVAHEALLREWTRLRDWLDSSRNDVRMQRMLAGAAAEWAEANEGPGFLLRDARLDQFAGWAESSTVALTQDEGAFLRRSIAAREARRDEEEARRRRELETAQKLAKTEHARAEEQAKSAGRLRKRAFLLLGALVVAAVLAIAAIFFANQSGQNADEALANADLATTREAEALAETEQRAIAQAEAEREKEQAESQAALATSRELASAAVANLEADPERSALLALKALDVVYTQEAEEALHRSLPRLRVLNTLSGHEDMVNDLAFSPDGTRLATVSSNATAKIWDTETGQELLSLEGHEEWIGQVAYSPDGTFVATASDDSTARIWDAATGEVLLILDGHKDNLNLQIPELPPAVGDVAISPDSTLVATASNDGTAKIWDAAIGQELRTISGDDHIVGRVTFSPDGARLALAGSDGFAQVIEVATGEVLFTMVGHESTFFSGIAYNPEGTVLATTADDQTMRLWDAETGQQLDVFPIGDSAGVEFSPDGSRLLTHSVDGTARIWGVATGRELLTLVGHQDRVWGATFSPDGERVATASADHTAKIWDLSPDHEVLTLTPFPEATPGELSALAISPDGSILVTAGSAGGVLLWDFGTGQEIMKLAGHEAWVGGVNFSPDGALLVTAADDQTVKVWDVQTGELHHTLEEPGGFINDAAFSPDGSLIAGVGFDQNAYIWDARSGDILYVMPLKEAAWGIAFSPDGSLLATGDIEGTISLWDVATGEPLREIVYDPNRFASTYRIAFTPDGAKMIVSALDGTVKVWDPQSGEELQTIKAHQSLIWGMDLSPDGRTLATAAGDSTARLWDLQSGERLLTLGEFSDPLTYVIFSQDGSQLVTAGMDGTVRVYELMLDELVDLAQSRLTRSLTDEECRQYLHLEVCP
ncbi:MAG: protein kinase [Candidatus Promineifilaceae bacterium]